jgi:uncharacterized protein YbcI
MIDYEFYFEAQTGTGSETVICKMQYEMDEDGPFNENIESIIFEGKEVIGLLTDEQYNELQVAGIYKLTKSIEEKEEQDE